MPRTATIDEADRKSAMIRLRVTKSQQRLFDRAAKSAALTLSAWLRTVAVSAAERVARSARSRK